MVEESFLKEFEAALNNPDKEPLCRCVVRLTTTCWYNEDGINIKKSLRFLKRKCQGQNILLEDANMIDPKEVIDRIINLNDCKDGIYDVVTCHEHGHWETPHIIEDYDYMLVPLK